MTSNTCCDKAFGATDYTDTDSRVRNGLSYMLPPFVDMSPPVFTWSDNVNGMNSSS